MKRLRLSKLAAAILLSAAAVYVLLLPQHYLGYVEDDAMYVVTAKAILSGEYTKLNVPDHPPQIITLPGFPIFLAPFVKAVDPSWALLKGLPFLLYLISGILLWWVSQGVLATGWRETLLALYLLNPLLASMSDLVLTEPLFIALTLFLISRLDSLKGSWRGAAVWGLGLGLGWLALIRPEGFLLAGCIGLIQMSQKKWKSLFPVWGIPVLALAGWGFRNHLAAGQFSGYISALEGYSGTGAHPWGQLYFQTTQFIRILVVYALAASPLPWISGGVFLALSGWGMHRLLARKGTALSIQVAVAFTLFYLLFHFYCPYLDARYCLPLVPFFLLFFIAGLQDISGRSLLHHKAAWGLAALLGLTYGVQTAHRVIQTRSHKDPSYYTLPAQTFAWVNSHVPPNALILTNKPTAVYLYTSRETTSAPGEMNDRKDFQRWISKSGVTHAVLRPQTLSDPERLQTWRQIDAWLKEGGAFQNIYDNPREGVRVYEVLRGKTVR